VQLVLVAGGNPIVPLSAAGIGTERLDGPWAELDAPDREATWDALLADWLGTVFPWSGAFRHDLPRLYAGRAFLGEISGPSDGLVFLDSALDASGLSARGATVVDAHTFEALSHPELVVAGRLAATVLGDPARAGVAFDPSLAAKYDEPENQAVDWIVARLLSAESPSAPDASTALDASSPADAETDAAGRAEAGGGPLGADGAAPPSTVTDSDPVAEGPPMADADVAGDGAAPADAGKRDLTGTSGRGDGCRAIPGGRAVGPGSAAIFGLFLFMLARRRSMSGSADHVQHPDPHRRKSHQRRVR
jgi:hypothetical protein